MDKKSPFYGLIVLGVKMGTKFVPFLLKFLKSAKFIKGGLAITSFASYAYLFTWKFALLIMVMLFVHESGHVWAMRKRGIKTKGFYFIPLIGGAAVPEESFRTRENEAYIAIMGPIWGLALSFASAVVFLATQDPLWAAGASWMALINLFNLLPINPLDGGRIIKSIVLSAAISKGNGEVKKVPVIIFLTVSVALVTAMAVFFNLWLLTFFGMIGVVEIISVLRNNTFEMVPMSKKQRGNHLALFFIVAVALTGIMYLTAHIPGAKEAFELLQDRQ